MEAIEYILRQKRFECLCRREKDILRLWNLSIKEQAAALGLSVLTVKTYRVRVRRKLGLRSIREVGTLIQEFEDTYREYEGAKTKLSFLCPNCGKVIRFGMKEVDGDRSE
jgi:hypothetical protein